jgi:hypothetical protein
MAIWYIFWLLDIYFLDLVCCSKKNLAALARVQGIIAHCSFRDKIEK